MSAKRGRPRNDSRPAPLNCPLCHRATSREDYGAFFTKCKKCVTKQHTEQQSKKRAAIKMKAVKFKGSKCESCNGIYPLAVYHFHHPKEKDFQISDALLVVPWNVIELELKECLLLCANCHAVAHVNYEGFLTKPLDE